MVWPKRGSTGSLFDYDSGLLYGAMLGNGRLNAAFDASLELRRLFSPVDEAHDAIVKFGEYGEEGLRWLSNGNAGVRNFVLGSERIEMFVDELEPVLAIKVKANSEVAMLAAMRLMCTNAENGVRFSDGALAFFRRENCLVLGAPFKRWSCSPDPVRELEERRLGEEQEGMRDWGAAAILEPNPEIFICGGSGPREAFGLMQKAKYMGYEEMKRRNLERWKGKDGPLKTSFYVLNAMQADNGAVVAAPEFDPETRYCGGYGYCWPRDAAFISNAMGILGMRKKAEKLVEWLAGVTRKGKFGQRYYIDGSPAPSWGEQADQAGAFLWAVEQHYKRTGDAFLVRRIFSSISDSADYLIEFLGGNGLTFDIWEERKGLHAYSCASAYGGLMSAWRVGKDNGMAKDEWRKTAEKLNREFPNTFWREELGSFIRTAGEEEEGGNSLMDASLIGISVPFGVFEPGSSMMKSTVARLEEKLMRESGLGRYEDDAYPTKGGVWPLATAWLAWYYAEAGDGEKSRRYIELVEKCADRFGFLPEQVDESFGARWVKPLAWSHAMYVTALESYEKLAAKGK
ncbi:MAG: glycoside hydrolase family 15 protein [Candidatus Micrarchaeota archaeon]|nr:glycoside hydrolase family 15 protein [Candidatus Micrarchaeota archaeon]